ncbi:MAG TPA: type II secretion system F family protein [Clostridiales bacterium]|nr:type II secretion system F family protein [Clostridiales bacterium]
MLRNNDCYPVFIKEISEKEYMIRLKHFQKVPVKEIAVFCRQFYTMLHNGITILSSLQTIKLQAKNKKFQKMIEGVQQEVQKGQTLSEAFEKYKDFFPDLFIRMVNIGEISGTLDIVMEKMANYYEKENRINNKIKNSLLYPILLSIVTAIIFIFLLHFVMPIFIGIFEESGISLPLPTQILIGFYNAVQKTWYILFMAAFIMICGIRFFIRTGRGKSVYDWLQIHIPIFKEATRKIIAARFTRTLSSLLSSGIPLTQALDAVSDVVGNIIVRQSIVKAKEEIQKGKSLTDSIQNIGIFPPMVISMLQVGEESGALDEILDKAADFYDDEVETILQQLTILFEPCMIIVMAGFIGFMAVAMLLPILDISNTIVY